jgi:hypothetical protein
MNSQNLRGVLIASCFGLLCTIMPSIYQSYNALGQNEEEATEQNKIKLARQVIKAFNTGDISNVSKFISTVLIVSHKVLQ